MPRTQELLNATTSLPRESRYLKLGAVTVMVTAPSFVMCGIPRNNARRPPVMGEARGCVLRAGVQPHRAGERTPTCELAFFAVDMLEVAHQLVVDVAAASAASAAYCGDGGDVLPR